MVNIDSWSRVLVQARAQAGLSQRELAERAATSQPAVARLERGEVSPTLATLERLVAAAGFRLRLELEPELPADPVIAVYKRDVDRTLLRENLRRTPDERLRMLADLQESGRELRGAVQAHGRGRDRQQ